MTFEEMLVELCKGKKARCAWWIQDPYIFINNHHLMYMSSRNKESFSEINGYDIINGDWEVIHEEL